MNEEFEFEIIDAKTANKKVVLSLLKRIFINIQDAIKKEEFYVYVYYNQYNRKETNMGIREVIKLLKKEKYKVSWNKEKRMLLISWGKNVT